MRNGVIWPHKRENNREIGLLLVSPAYSTMKSTAARSLVTNEKDCCSAF